MTKFLNTEIDFGKKPTLSPAKLVFAVIALFAFGVIFGVPGYLVSTQKSQIVVTQPTSTLEPTIAPEVTPEIDVSDWKTYRNEEYGFEMKYPLGFTEQKTESDEALLTVTKKDQGSSYYFGISIRKNYKVDQIISTIKDAKEINIGNHLGYEYFYIEGAGTSEVALIQVGEDALNISFDLIGSNQNFATADDRKIYVQDFFNQILSTFKFIK